MIKLFTVYDLDYNLIAQFDDYKNLSNYIGCSIDCLQSYFSKKKSNIQKTMTIKETKQKVILERDYIKENVDD